MKRLPKGKEAKALVEVVKKVLYPYSDTIQTITSDNGTEFAEHKSISKYLNTDLYFAKPYSSWQRGANENTNKLIRQDTPKKSDLRTLTKQISEYQKKINTSPRKKLNFDTPFERFCKFVL